MNKRSTKTEAKVALINKDGTKGGSISLPKELVQEGSLELLAQAMHVYTDRRHRGTKDAKTRAEVDITKKKIYRQKGTGGARHGASSAHIFVGGGVAHGPKPIKRILKLSQNMRKRALQIAMAYKSSEGKVVAVEGISSITKTSQAQKLIDAVVKEIEFKNSPRRMVVVYKNDNMTAVKALRNIQNVIALPVKNLNAYDVFTAGLVLVDQEIGEKATETNKKSETKVSKRKGSNK